MTNAVLEKLPASRYFLATAPIGPFANRAHGLYFGIMAVHHRLIDRSSRL